MLKWLFREADRLVGLSPRDLVLRSSLILHDLHYRDALASHFACESNIKNRMSTSRNKLFGISWDIMLKHRLDDSTTVGYECHVEMNGLKVPYGFHYVSPASDTSNSIITPGSMRSLLLLFACIRNAQGAMLMGPAASGKATLAFQVSQILGRQFFGTSTSAPTMIAHVLRLLRGALHAGGTFSLSVPELTPSAIEVVRVVATILGGIEVR